MKMKSGIVVFPSTASAGALSARLGASQSAA